MLYKNKIPNVWRIIAAVIAINIFTSSVPANSALAFPFSEANSKYEYFPSSVATVTTGEEAGFKGEWEGLSYALNTEVSKKGETGEFNRLNSAYLVLSTSTVTEKNETSETASESEISPSSFSGNSGSTTTEHQSSTTPANVAETPSKEAENIPTESHATTTSEENDTNSPLPGSDSTADFSESENAPQSTENNTENSEPPEQEQSVPEPAPDEKPAESSASSRWRNLFGLVSVAYASTEQEQNLSASSSSRINSPRLEFSGFKPNQDITSTSTPLEVSLNLSFSSVPLEGAELSIEYSTDGTSWSGLSNLNLNNPDNNFARGGYLSLQIPIDSYENISNIKIRLSYSYNENSGLPPEAVFIDSVWIEAVHAMPGFSWLQNNLEIPANVLYTENGFNYLELESKYSKLGLPGSLDDPFLYGETGSIFKELRIIPLGAEASSTAVRREDSIVYNGAFPATNLRYEILESGLKENIELIGEDHPSEFGYLANLSDFDVSSSSDSQIELYRKGKSGQELFKLYTISAPVMTDANGNSSSAIKLATKGNVLVVTPDPEWLESATYPVIIDPTVEISVLNIHSHPVEGDVWAIEFTTLGEADLSVTPGDDDTVSDMRFHSLSCDGRELEPEVSKSGAVIFENWSCNGIGRIEHEVLRTGNHHFIFDFGGEEADAYNAALVWKGTTNSLWSVGSNWSTGSKPTSADSVTFDNTCTNCDVTIDEDATVTSFTIAATYAGIISQNTGADLIATGAFSQNAGTFIGGEATTTFNNAFTIASGNFTAASSTVFGGNAHSTLNVVSSLTFENLTFSAGNNYAKTISSGDTFIVTRTLYLTDGRVLTGTIDARSDIIQASTFDIDNTALIDFGNDSLSQTWTVNGGNGPIVRFNSVADASDSIIFNAAGILYGATTTSDFSGTIPISNASNYDITIDEGGWRQAAGNFSYGNANFTVRSMTLSGGAFTGGEGTFTFNDSVNGANFIISGGTFTAASTTVISGVNPNINILTTQNFEDFTLDTSGSLTISSGDTLVIAGDLVLTDGGTYGGIMDVHGNITQAAAANIGSTIVDFGDDSVAQTWTVSGGGGPKVRFDSAADANDSVIFNAAGTLGGLFATSTFSGTIPISNAGNYSITFGGIWMDADIFTIRAGTFNHGAWNLTIKDNFTLSGGVFNGGSGTVTFNDGANGADIVISGGVFTAASTTVFSGVNPSIDVPTTMTFEDVTLNTPGGGFTITSGDTLVITGDLTLTDGTLRTGTVDLRGNIIQNGGTVGNATVDFGDDSLAQTWTVNGGGGPKVRFDSVADASDSVIFNAAGTLGGLFATSTFSGNIPISNTGNYNITFGGVFGDANVFTIRTGTFNHGAWNLIIKNNFTLSGGTFNGGSGTITFNDAVNGADVVISGGTFTAASTTVFSGANPSIDVPTSQVFEAVTLNTPGGGLTITAGDTLVITGDLNLTDGQLRTGTAQAQADVTVASTFDGGTSPLQFTGSSNQNFNLTGGTGLFNADITVNKTGGQVDLLSALVMDAANQDLVIQEGTLDLNGNNLTVSGTGYTFVVQDGGNLQMQGVETLTAPTIQTGSTVTYDGSDTYSIKDYPYKNLAITGSGIYSTPNTTEDAVTFTQTTGTFTAPSGNFTITGNFTHAGGIFTHNSGTVVLNGANQIISGNTTFNNLTKSTAAADTLTFASSNTQTVEGALTLNGASSNLLSLRSSVEGEQWNIDPRGTRTIAYLDVKDSNNINATMIDASAADSLNSGNNTNWDFGETFAQQDFQFFENADSATPGASLALQNTGLTLASLINPVRLRINILIGAVDLAALTRSFILQVSNLASGGWENVGATTTVDFYNNPSVSSGTTLPSTILSNSTVAGTYEEAAPGSRNPLLASVGDYLEHDFSLDISGMIEGLSYFFRLISSDGSELDSYVNYPEMIYTSPPEIPETPPGNGNGTDSGGHRRGGDGGVNSALLSSVLLSPDGNSYSDSVSGVAGITSFQVRASIFGAVGSLKYEFDFDEDGIYEKSFESNKIIFSVPYEHIFKDEGIHFVKMKVTDNSGKISYSSASASVERPYLNVSLSGSLNHKDWAPQFEKVSTSSKVSLQAAVQTNLPGQIQYKFDCESDKVFEKTITSFKTLAEANNICKYPAKGIYTASVQVSINGMTGEGSIKIAVNALLPEPPLPAPQEPPVTPEPPEDEENDWVPPIDEIIDEVQQIIEDIANEFGDSSIAFRTEDFILLSGRLASNAVQIVRAAPQETATVAIGTSVLAPTALALQYSIVSKGIFANIFTFYDLWLSLLGTLQGLFTSIGLRKRRRYWGTVYDALNKQGIDPAIVDLIDANTGKVVEKSVTDLFGRFGFLDRPGRYVIRASKTHYRFPSQIVQGGTDGIFSNIYHGEEFEIRGSDDVLAPNIPMDPLASDWNQEEKKRKGIGKINFRFELAVMAFLKTIFWVGFIIMMFVLYSHPSLTNTVFFAIYSILIWLNRYIPNPHLWGKVESSSFSTSNLLLELEYQALPGIMISKTTTNNRGKFFLKAQPGEYNLFIKQIGDNVNTTLKKLPINIGKESVFNKVVNL